MMNNLHKRRERQPNDAERNNQPIRDAQTPPIREWNIGLFPFQTTPASTDGNPVGVGGATRLKANFGPMAPMDVAARLAEVQRPGENVQERIARTGDNMPQFGLILGGLAVMLIVVLWGAQI